MSYIDTTFGRGGELIKTCAKVYGGWDSTRTRGYQFYDHEYIDYKGDIRLRVAVWMGRAFRPSGHVDEFPLDFTAQFDDGMLQASIAAGRLSLSIGLRQESPWIVTSNGKLALDWGPQVVAQRNEAAYLLRHMIVFNFPYSRRGDYREWNLLPFLPGGLVERNRRRH
jgi:hypothetical protein